MMAQQPRMWDGWPSWSVYDPIGDGANMAKARAAFPELANVSDEELWRAVTETVCAHRAKRRRQYVSSVAHEQRGA